MQTWESKTREELEIAMIQMEKLDSEFSNA